jgi:hypothetical protein
MDGCGSSGLRIHKEYGRVGGDHLDVEGEKFVTLPIVMHHTHVSCDELAFQPSILRLARRESNFHCFRTHPFSRHTSIIPALRTSSNSFSLNGNTVQHDDGCEQRSALTPQSSPTTSHLSSPTLGTILRNLPKVDRIHEHDHQE